ncbi:hypothetical protein V6N12_004365 [Hibiscus sabdariffa]|uniref:Uncharacterized protein n=1 Tax=Hibiscus sabdariffa TaxID=183260 RepID=A0ABR2CLB0_9ROSI
MAETFLFTIAEKVLGKVAALSMEQISLVFNVKTDLRKLKETMSSIKAVLLDAERQQHHNEKLRLCMWKLRNIFYDAEDVIDDFRCETLRKQVVNHPDISLKVRFLSSCTLPLLFSLKMGHKIKEINRRLDELATEWNSFNLVQCSDNRHVFHRETHSFVKSSDVFGRDEDKEKIIDLLKRPSKDGDDVWNENQAAWVELRDLLGSMDGSSESKIIVTTRSLKVASIMSSIRPYELKGLPHEHCLTLFKRWAFNDGDGRQHPNLMRIGEEIVRKCKGVPLAVRTLGSLLFLKSDETEWVSVRDSEMCTLEQGKNDILPVLKLSYNYLPSHLQRCLAFLSLYKKDETYDSDEVVRLWIANGLLEHPRQKQEWEDVGHQYLNELLWRCLIQKEEDFELGFTFKMHDLIHDLALHVSQKECKIVDSQTEETVDENVRHLTFYDVTPLRVVQVLRKLKNVRTIIIQEDWNDSIESLINLCASNFKYLRLLKLPYSRHGALPNSIGTLKHIRYLHSRSWFLPQVPNSFYKLRCLQTLNMVGIDFSMQLPDKIEGLIELRYLVIQNEGNRLKEIRLGLWTSLQCLKLVYCHRLECLPEGMQHLTSLRTLILYYCIELVSLPRSLKFLTKLEVLHIHNCWRLNLEMEPEEEEDKHLQLSLKTLSLERLHALRGLPRLLLLGSTSTLQTIWIRDCSSFVELPTWLQHLTSLHRFDIADCPELSALPDGMDRLTRLEQLNIQRCPKLSERYGQGRGADWHKIAHIPNVRFS